MADPTLTNKFVIQLGDGGGPEVFAHTCGANARSVKFTNNMGEDVTLDCTDPTGVIPAIQRWVESQDTTLNISGRVAKESLSTWRGWSDDATKKNVKILIDEAGADGGGFWVVAAYLSDFEMSAENTGTATFTASIVGTGTRVWTDAA